MKTAIVYYSKHHGNTKKLIDAIATVDSTVSLIDVTDNPDTDLSDYDRIGFASGIGSNSTILPGITIGDNAVIGAGSVVTKDIPENMIAVGSPAKVIRSIFD